MIKRFAQTISLILAVCILTGCRLPFAADDRTEGERKYPEFLTVDVFDIQSNTQGLQRGWFAYKVREKFNMQLNVIAPNVESSGDATYETMRASGKLGDIILINVDSGRFSDLVREGLVLDITDYIDGSSNLKKYLKQIEVTSAYAGTDGLWAVPSEISDDPATEPSEFTEPTNAPTIRWDLYKEVGYPRLATLEDILPVLKEMQNAAGESDSGKKVYGFSLFGDWDGGAMQNAGSLASLYGYDPQGFVMLNPETGDIQSIADKDSVYLRMLHFLFKANSMGLVDPESGSQNYEKVAAKFKDGAVLYSFWPWMGESLYNSDEHLALGKGFASVALADASYISWGNDPDGKQNFCIMVGGNTRDPQRMVDFVDWLYSDEGIECCGSPTGDIRGPENLTWENTENGPVLTQFGIDAFINMKRGLEVPEELGGGTWTEGISSLNFKPVDKKNNDDNGIPFYYQLFDDYRNKTSSSITDDWQAHYKTEKLPIDYYEEKGMLTVIPGTEWADSEYPEYIKIVEAQCRQTIIDYSWKMVFAQSEEEFDSLRDAMISTLDRLGFDEVVEINKAFAKERLSVLKKAASGESISSGEVKR